MSMSTDEDEKKARLASLVFSSLILVLICAASHPVVPMNPISRPLIHYHFELQQRHYEHLRGCVLTFTRSERDSSKPILASGISPPNLDWKCDLQSEGGDVAKNLKPINLCTWPKPKTISVLRRRRRRRRAATSCSRSATGWGQGDAKGLTVTSVNSVAWCRIGSFRLAIVEQGVSRLRHEFKSRHKPRSPLEWFGFEEPRDLRRGWKSRHKSRNPLDPSPLSTRAAYAAGASRGTSRDRPAVGVSVGTENTEPYWNRYRYRLYFSVRYSVLVMSLIRDSGLGTRWVTFGEFPKAVVSYVPRPPPSGNFLSGSPWCVSGLWVARESGFKVLAVLLLGKYRCVGRELGDTALNYFEKPWVYR
ncbi:hypothetical protein L6452_29921 [Arctium lappa]|uniref:Uncharacterized protein n=1 Tax=Arctium lappa TaxID=4217 RepID=A0ACB8ZHV2_ARCLA|nr:hypothetical protein L6452_29921 [Arctium lappa]